MQHLMLSLEHGVGFDRPNLSNKDMADRED